MPDEVKGPIFRLYRLDHKLAFAAHYKRLLVIKPFMKSSKRIRRVRLTAKKSLKNLTTT
jgi:hypothetical protein